MNKCESGPKYLFRSPRFKDRRRKVVLLESKKEWHTNAQVDRLMHGRKGVGFMELKATGD